MVILCVPTLRRAEAKKLIGSQGQNGKHEMGSDLSASSPSNHCRDELVVAIGLEFVGKGDIPHHPKNQFGSVSYIQMSENVVNMIFHRLNRH